jgi:hypothetical protein
VRRRIALSLTAALLSAKGARAEPVHVSAERIEVDTEGKELILRGDVELDSAPFHLTSPELRLSRSSHGVVVHGKGRIAFCPCLAQPIAVTFRSATIAPPGDLLLDKPTLEVFHVPVLWLPFFWLRSRGNVGLLAPTLAYRGRDGLFLGEGAHLPSSPGNTESGLDLQAGAYLNGGIATEATLRTPESITTVRWDHLAPANGAATTAALLKTDTADGVTIDARGTLIRETSFAGPSLAWDVDAVRGQRGVVSTTDLDAASRVFDRAAAEGVLRGGGWTVTSGLRATDPRGAGLGDVGAAGPTASVRRDGAVGEMGAYDAHVEGGAIAGALIPTTSFGRAGGGVLLAAHAGPLRATWSLRGSGDLAAAGAVDGFEGALQTRAEVALPLERSFRSSDPNDPYWHRVEPRIQVGALAAGSEGLDLDPPVLGFGPAPAASVSSGTPEPGALEGAAWIADGGLGSTLGRWGAREGLELQVSAGAAGSYEEAASAVVRWRGAASLTWFGLGAEGAHVVAGSTRGYALSTRFRIGSLTSLHLGVHVAGRAGMDPVLARAMTDAPLPASMGFLAAVGWTGGARLSVPLTAYLTAGGGADADLSEQRLLAARGSLEFHDRCGCVVIAAKGAERLGRSGVDVWMTVSLVQK